MGAEVLQQAEDAAGACAIVASDQQDTGPQIQLVIDRDTASRLGITPQEMDDALYDGFGQRQVSTMFTQSNQYHVVLEVAPQFSDQPADLNSYLRAIRDRRAGSAGTFAQIEQTTAPLTINHQGQFPSATYRFNLAPGRVTWDGGEGHQAGQEVDRICRASIQAEFQGTARAFESSLTKRIAADPRGAGDGLYRARRAV